MADNNSEKNKEERIKLAAQKILAVYKYVLKKKPNKKNVFILMECTKAIIKMIDTVEDGGHDNGGKGINANSSDNEEQIDNLTPEEILELIDTDAIIQSGFTIKEIRAALGIIESKIAYASTEGVKFFFDPAAAVSTEVPAAIEGPKAEPILDESRAAIISSMAARVAANRRHVGRYRFGQRYAAIRAQRFNTEGLPISREEFRAVKIAILSRNAAHNVGINAYRGIVMSRSKRDKKEGVSLPVSLNEVQRAQFGLVTKQMSHMFGGKREKTGLPSGIAAAGRPVVGKDGTIPGSIVGGDLGIIITPINPKSK